MNVFAVAFGQ